jgi:hypothetical protein
MRIAVRNSRGGSTRRFTGADGHDVGRSHVVGTGGTIRALLRSVIQAEHNVHFNIRDFMSQEVR